MSECILQTAEQIREKLRHPRYELQTCDEISVECKNERPFVYALVDCISFDYNFAFSGYRTFAHESIVRTGRGVCQSAFMPLPMVTTCCCRLMLIPLSTTPTP